MSQSRQLAAIMFTDIVGYTLLMGDDEQNAFELLRKNRQLQKPFIEQYNGVWIKELGDGILASFSTVTEAVLCASEIQKACTGIDDLKLRIGIHQGEVVFEDNDVFGDGVNIAARLQALAPIGGIWVSESVHKNISNKKEINSRFIKEELLKNVKEPVRIYEVQVEGTQAEQPKHSFTTKELSQNPSGQSIAVLPFVDMSPAHDQEYLGDGIADEIIIAIAKIKQLKVSSRSSSFSFKNHEDARIIGKKLGVSNILEGSIKKSGERLRISAQLINVDDGFQLWSDIYQMDVRDIFIIQEHIAQSVVENLKLKFALLKDKKIVDVGTQNPEAYDLYLKGRFFWYKRYKGGLQLSLNYFEKAIEKDAHFAKPYAGTSDVAYVLGIYGLVKSGEAREKSSSALKRAFELNPALPEAFISKGLFEAFFTLNWSNALAAWRQAINLNPSAVDCRSWLATGLALMHSPKDEVIDEIMQVLQSAPNAFFAHTICGYAYGALGELKKANEILKNVLQQDPENVLACYLNGIVSWQLKDFGQTEECLEKAVALSGRFAFMVSILCAFYGYISMDKKNTELLEELENRNETEYISHGVLAVAYAGTGRKNEAYYHLELGFAEKDPTIHFLICVPLWSTIHNEERFKKLFETYMPISWEIYYKCWGRDIG